MLWNLYTVFCTGRTNINGDLLPDVGDDGGTAPYVPTSSWIILVRRCVFSEAFGQVITNLLII
jgi:hypothetical protein